MTDRPLLFFCGDLCNLGDLALLMQNLEAKAPERRAYVRRWSGLPDEIVFQVEAAGGFLVNGRRGLRFAALARRCDIVIGGGQLVRDNISLRSLVFQYAAALAARAGGGTVTTRGLGVGAIRNGKRRILWRALLRLTPKVFVRDTASEHNAAALVGSNRVVRTADMAFLPSRLHTAAHADEVAGDRVLIAPCIDLSEDRSIDGLAFPALLAAIRAALPDQALVFACHDPRPGMDGFAADRLIDAHALSDARKSDGYDLAALLGEYHAAALIVTNRLHAVIFSLLADRPVLVVDDGTRKTAAMAERFGIPSVTMADAAAMPGAVRAALDYDAPARARALTEMARQAARNLEN